MLDLCAHILNVVITGVLERGQDESSLLDPPGGSLQDVLCVLGLCLWGYGVFTDVRPVCTHTKCSNNRRPGVRAG